MRKFLVALAVSSVAVPASAATLVDTGVNPTFTNARPVNSTTTLLGQFNLASDSQIQSVETYGRVVTGGEGFYAIYANAGSVPGALLYQAAATFSPTGLQFVGIGGLAWNLVAGDYWVGYGQTSGSSFTSYVTGSAPNGLGLEGSFKPSGYVATNAVDLSWRISGISLASAAPEPATWAMMIAGFGLVGGAMRYSRRRTKVTFATA